MYGIKWLPTIITILFLNTKFNILQFKNCLLLKLIPYSDKITYIIYLFIKYFLLPTKFITFYIQLTIA